MVGTQLKHQSSRSHCSIVIHQLNVFKKVSQTPVSQGQNFWDPLKGLIKFSKNGSNSKIKIIVKKC